MTYYALGCCGGNGLGEDERQEWKGSDQSRVLAIVQVTGDGGGDRKCVYIGKYLEGKPRRNVRHVEGE